MERFGSMTSLIKTFEKFAKLVSKDGFILVDGTDANNQKLIKRVDARFITYCLSGKLEYTAENMKFKKYSKEQTKGVNTY